MVKCNLFNLGMSDIVTESNRKSKIGYKQKTGGKCEYIGSCDNMVFPLLIKDFHLLLKVKEKQDAISLSKDVIIKFDIKNG